MHTGNDQGVFTICYVNLFDRTGTVIFTNSANGPKMVLPILERLRQHHAFVEFLRRQAG